MHHTARGSRDHGGLGAQMFCSAAKRSLFFAADMTTPPPPYEPPAAKPAAHDGAPAAVPPTQSARLASTIADFASTQKRRRFAFRLLFLCLICLGMGHSIMFATLPALSRELGISESMTQAVFSLSAFIWVFMSPFWGRRSDFMGRRPVILIGLIGYATSTILFTSVVAGGLAGLLTAAFFYPMMIATRTIYGVLGPGAMASAQAYVADRTTRAERTKELANIGAAFGLGIVIGAGIGGPIAEVFGLLGPLYFVAALAVISAAAVWFVLPERSAPQKREDTPKVSLLDKRLRTFLLVSLLMGISSAVPIQSVSFFLMDKLVLDPETQGIQFTSVALMALSMATLFSQLVIVQRFPMSAQRLVQFGAISVGLGGVLFMVSTEFSTLILGLVLIGLGLGLERPGLAGASSLSVSHKEQGSVSGLVGGMGAAGFIFIPPLTYFLYPIDPSLMFGVITVLSVVVLIISVVDPSFRRATLDVDDETPPIDV